MKLLTKFYICNLRELSEQEASDGLPINQTISQSGHVIFYIWARSNFHYGLIIFHAWILKIVFIISKVLRYHKNSEKTIYLNYLPLTNERKSPLNLSF